MGQHDPEKLKAFWNYCETWKSLAMVLMTAHGAGLAYCLTELNKVAPRYNVGPFIALFTLGLLFGGLFFLIVTILKAELTTAIVAQERPGRTLRGLVIEYSGLAGLWGSILAFVAAIGLFAYRFWVA